MYLIKFKKDKPCLKAAGLEAKAKAKALLNLMQDNPFQNPPPYEKLVGNLSGNLSRRINIQHRLVYAVLENIDGYAAPTGELYDGIILVKRMWTHYE